MKIHKWFDPGTDMLKVAILLNDHGDGVRTYMGRYGSHEVIGVASGAQAPIYLEIPQHIATAMGLHADDYVEQRDATTWHLEDAIGVRDRLLTLIEKGPSHDS